MLYFLSGIYVSGYVLAYILRKYYIKKYELKGKPWTLGWRSEALAWSIASWFTVVISLIVLAVESEKEVKW